jgi:hypothetical protein
LATIQQERLRDSILTIQVCSTVSCGASERTAPFGYRCFLLDGPAAGMSDKQRRGLLGCASFGIRTGNQASRARARSHSRFPFTGLCVGRHIISKTDVRYSLRAMKALALKWTS